MLQRNQRHSSANLKILHDFLASLLVVVLQTTRLHHEMTLEFSGAHVLYCGNFDILLELLRLSTFGGFVFKDADLLFPDLE